jgi:hypothetical protein
MTLATGQTRIIACPVASPVEQRKHDIVMLGVRGGAEPPHLLAHQHSG